MQQNARLNDDDLRRKLAQCGSQVGLISALEHLRDAGWLRPEVGRFVLRNAKRKLDAAVAQHATAMTPYGSVLQSMRLPVDALPKWHFIHPLAFLHYLSSLSATFGDMMRESSTPGTPMSLILYIDEICPGNPLRPERSRTLQAIYWAFADWPQHILQRTSMWPTFGTIRSTIVSKLPGNVGGLIKMIMHTFFPNDGRVSMAHGFSLVLANGENLIVSARLGGIIADEKAHHEISGSKGASGTKCCPDCKNVFNRVDDAHLVDGCVSIRCSDPTLFVPHTNESIHEIYDFLAASDPSERGVNEQLLGYKYNPDGILGDMHLRTIYKPKDHTLRDFQHTLLSGGVANVEVACIMKNVVLPLGLSIDFMQDYISQFTLPSSHGKVNRAWLGKNRFGKKMRCLASFSSTMLSVVPLLANFLVDWLPEAHPLYAHVDCFWKLHLIVGICTFGPGGAMPFVDSLRQLIRQHAIIFSRLYPESVRPKFHHLFHIPDNMEFLGKLLSCFVTERKHRVTKRAALHTFRGIDNSVVKALLNKHCQKLLSDDNVFLRQYVVGGRIVDMYGVQCRKSKAAVLPCGGVKAKDLLWLDDHTVSKIICFWEHAGNVVIEVAVYTSTNVQLTLWSVDGALPTMIPSDRVVAAVAWAHHSAGVIRVARPVMSFMV